MTIRYRTTRRDIWQFYCYTWRHGVRMNVLRLFIVVSSVITAEAWLRGPVPSTAWRLAASAAIAALVLALVAVYPLLRFKRDERTLTISPTGIATTIGALRGNVPWTRVAQVAPVGTRIYVIGTSGNGFIVPPEAFATEPERVQFVESAMRWHREARNA